MNYETSSKETTYELWKYQNKKRKQGKVFLNNRG